MCCRLFVASPLLPALSGDSQSTFSLFLLSIPLFCLPSIFWLHYFLVLFAFRQSFLPLFSLLPTNSFLPFRLFHSCLCFASLFTHFMLRLSLLRLTYPPCPVILSLLFLSLTSLFHYFAIPLFSGYRLSLASTHLPALSGDSQLSFSLPLSLFSGYHLSLSISLSPYFLAIASLYASPLSSYA